MPTLARSKIPPPRDWGEFQDITLTALKIKWSSPNLSHNGRNGQAQAGVDIYGEDDLGRHAGVQCKLDLKTIEEVRAEVQKAERFEPSLAEFFMATSAQTDATLQRQIRLLSAERVAAGKFPVGVFFWEDLIQELVKNRAEFAKHYPDIALPQEQGYPLVVRLAGLLTLAYYGLNISYYLELLFGELSNTQDAKDFESIMDSIANAATLVMDSEASSRFVSVSREFVRYSMACARGEESGGWRPAKAVARQLEALVKDVELKLVGRETAAFRTGGLLATWDRIAMGDKDDKDELPDTIAKELVSSVNRLANRDVAEQIQRTIKEYNEETSVSKVHVPGRVYNTLRKALRDEAMEG